MRKQFQTLIPPVVISFLTLAAGNLGCTQDYDSGTDVATLQNTSFIVKGKTTEQELITHFGKPMTETTSGDGSTMLQWVGSHATTDGPDFFSRAVIGTVAAGWTPSTTANTQSLSVSVTVNKDGIVTDVTSSATNNNSTVP